MIGMKAKVDLLLKTVRYHLKCPSELKQSLLDIAVLCNTQGDVVKDQLRKASGLRFIIKVMLAATQTDVKSAAIYTLSCAAERNFCSQKELCTVSLFSYINGLLSSPNSSTPLMQTVTYLILVLVSNNSLGQNLARTSGCLESLLNLLKNLLMKRLENVTQGDLWSNVITALTVCINNPCNDSNQRLCAPVFPFLFQTLEVSVDYDIIRHLASLISVATANNVYNQERVCYCGGMEVLVNCMCRLSSKARTDPESLTIQSCIQALCSCLDSAVTEHVENADYVGKHGGIGIMLQLLPVISDATKLQVIVTMGHCIDVSKENQQELIRSDGVSILIQQIAKTSADEPLRHAIKYILQSCTNKGTPTNSFAKRKISDDKLFDKSAGTGDQIQDTNEQRNSPQLKDLFLYNKDVTEKLDRIEQKLNESLDVNLLESNSFVDLSSFLRETSLMNSADMLQLAQNTSSINRTSHNNPTNYQNPLQVKNSKRTDDEYCSNRKKEDRVLRSQRSSWPSVLNTPGKYLDQNTSSVIWQDLELPFVRDESIANPNSENLYQMEKNYGNSLYRACHHGDDVNYLTVCQKCSENFVIKDVSNKENLQTGMGNQRNSAQHDWPNSVSVRCCDASNNSQQTNSSDLQRCKLQNKQLLNKETPGIPISAVPQRIQERNRPIVDLKNHQKDCPVYLSHIQTSNSCSNELNEDKQCTKKAVPSHKCEQASTGRESCMQHNGNTMMKGCVQSKQTSCNNCGDVGQVQTSTTEDRPMNGGGDAGIKICCCSEVLYDLSGSALKSPMNVSDENLMLSPRDNSVVFNESSLLCKNVSCSVSKTSQCKCTGAHNSENVQKYMPIHSRTYTDLFQTLNKSDEDVQVTVTKGVSCGKNSTNAETCETCGQESSGNDDSNKVQELKSTQNEQDNGKDNTSVMVSREPQKYRKKCSALVLCPTKKNVGARRKILSKQVGSFQQIMAVNEDTRATSVYEFHDDSDDDISLVYKKKSKKSNVRVTKKKSIEGLNTNENCPKAENTQKKLDCEDKQSICFGNRKSCDEDSKRAVGGSEVQKRQFIHQNSHNSSGSLRPQDEETQSIYKDIRQRKRDFQALIRSPEFGYGLKRKLDSTNTYFSETYGVKKFDEQNITLDSGLKCPGCQEPSVCDLPPLNSRTFNIVIETSVHTCPYHRELRQQEREFIKSLKQNIRDSAMTLNKLSLLAKSEPFLKRGHSKSTKSQVDDKLMQGATSNEPFSMAEERRLKRGVKLYGYNWELIATKFCFNIERTGDDLKSKWQALNKKF